MFRLLKDPEVSPNAGSRLIFRVHRNRGIGTAPGDLGPWAGLGPFRPICYLISTGGNHRRCPLTALAASKRR